MAATPTRPGFIVVRPEPGNAATVARLRARGLDAIGCPLFAVAPLAWAPPDPAGYDALLVTSANAIRHGGPGLVALRSLPVVAVGAASATAARAAGFTVATVGDGDAPAAVALARDGGLSRLLHLAGRDRRAVVAAADTIVAYASEPTPVPPESTSGWCGRTVLLHSPRAARRVAALAGDRRDRIGIVALSPAVLAAAGEGWRAGHAAPVPSEDALVALAARLGD